MVLPSVELRQTWSRIRKSSVVDATLGAPGA